jgi:hypothetical protein
MEIGKRTCGMTTKNGHINGLVLLALCSIENSIEENVDLSTTITTMPSLKKLITDKSSTTSSSNSSKLIGRMK